jgi:Response regulator containing CheY-like receiver, AAA-type ATPase, and DNA-binding domains
VTRILIADDQRDVLEALRILLKSEGYQTEGVTSLAGVFHALEKKEYALLLMDLNYTRDTTSGQEGLSAISKIQEIDSTLPIVVMTAGLPLNSPSSAMKRGARDFVPSLGTTSDCWRSLGRRSSSRRASSGAETRSGK